MNTPNELGPLPLGDRKETQQQLSLNALRNRLPKEKFLVRDERTDDKGVDVALEAKVEVRVPKKSAAEADRGRHPGFASFRRRRRDGGKAHPDPGP